MNIAIGTDHSGFLLKEEIKDSLQKAGHKVTDFGAHSETPVDYPLYIRPVAEAVAQGEYERGIILGGSGNGEAIVANRIKGIRCTLCWNIETARLARRHNDSNMLSLGARLISRDDAIDIVKVWLDTPFDGGRHRQRIRQIDHWQDPPEGGVARKKGLDSKETPGSGKASMRADKPETDSYDVLISFRYIIYTEGPHTIEFQVDPGLKRPSVIHIPSPERWQSEMAPWARDRRDEILSRLKEKCVHMECDFKES